MSSAILKQSIEEGVMPELPGRWENPDNDLVAGYVAVIQEVFPQDGSPNLPLGNYRVRDIKWLSWSDSEPRFGCATFVVDEEEHTSKNLTKKRRIGMIRWLG